MRKAVKLTSLLRHGAVLMNRATADAVPASIYVPLLYMDLKREVTCSDAEDAFLGKYDGKLRDADSNEVAGRVGLYVVDLDGAGEAGHPAFDVLDSEAATAEYIELLSAKEDGNFSPAVNALLNDAPAFSNNMLIINVIELLPSYRGYGLGLTCMETCLRHFRLGCRIAAIKPFPLQFLGGIKDSDDWSAGLQLASLDGNKRTSTQKLRKHYARLGFRHVRGTQLMIYDLYS